MFKPSAPPTARRKPVAFIAALHFVLPHFLHCVLDDLRCLITIILHKILPVEWKIPAGKLTLKCPLKCRMDYFALKMDKISRRDKTFIKTREYTACQGNVATMGRDSSPRNRFLQLLNNKFVAEYHLPITWISNRKMWVLVVFFILF